MWGSVIVGRGCLIVGYFIEISKDYLTMASLWFLGLIGWLRMIAKAFILFFIDIVVKYLYNW